MSQIKRDTFREIVENVKIDEVFEHDVDDDLDRDFPIVEKEEYHPVFRLLNERGMPWEQETSSDEDCDVVLEKDLRYEIDDEISMDGVSEMLLGYIWKGELTMKIPMFGLWKLIGGEYLLDLKRQEEDLISGINVYNEEETSVTLRHERKNGKVMCIFSNSDEIHFEGVLNVTSKVLKGSLYNSDVPQGKGEFVLVGTLRN